MPIRSPLSRARAETSVLLSSHVGFEHRRHRLLSRREFAARWGKWAAGAIGLMMASWAVGALGYRLTEGWGWIDDFHAAALILSAMGPAQAVQTDAGKWFESAYALFSGVVFISIAAMLLGPIAHRILHRFHLDDEDLGATDHEGGGQRTEKRLPSHRAQR